MTDGLRDTAKTIMARCRWFCSDPVRRLELEHWCRGLLKGKSNEKTAPLLIELLLDCRKREARRLASRLAWASYGDGWPDRVEGIRRDIEKRRKLRAK